MVEALIFYLFAGVMLVAGFMVVAAKNPVHSVLFLILAFFNSAGLFVLLGAEFLAMILVIVYVGAVAVLFLFVVMMLNINYVELREGFLQYVHIGALVGIVLLVEMSALFFTKTGELGAPGAGLKPVPTDGGLTNTEMMGQLLYTDYIYVFQAAGLVLLVAMIGAIVLTHRTRKGVKRQNISKQIRRTAKDAIEVKKVGIGKGI